MAETKKENGSVGKIPAKRHLKNFLIDRQFQLRWMFRVIIIISIIVAIMGYFLYQTIADATDQMVAQKLGDSELTDASVHAFVDQAARDKRLTVYTLTIWLFSLVVFVSLATIALTHRIAGPIYKMRRIFREISGSNLCLWENRLRRADELKEVFEELDDMLRRLREDRRDDVKIIEKAREKIEQNSLSDELASDMNKLIRKFQRSIEMK